MKNIYKSSNPIYSLFDLKVEILDYLLNEYQYIIEYNDENDEIVGMTNYYNLGIIW